MIRSVAAVFVGVVTACAVFWNLRAVAGWGPNGGAHGHVAAPAGLVVMLVVVAGLVGAAITGVVRAALRDRR